MPLRFGAGQTATAAPLWSYPWPAAIFAIGLRASALVQRWLQEDRLVWPGRSMAELRSTKVEPTAALFYSKLGTNRIVQLDTSAGDNVSWTSARGPGRRRIDPQLHFVFAPPMRVTAEEPHIVNTVHEKEVVQIVQREVQTAFSSGAAVLNLSREDYSHLANHLYSSLAQRLLVEKERRGLPF